MENNTEAQYQTIETREQYFKYCKKLEDLVDTFPKTRPIQREIDQLTSLIEAWDEDHNTFDDSEE